MAAGTPLPALLAGLRGRPLAVLLDIDGTLCELTDDPTTVTVPGPTRDVLRRLAARPDVTVAFVTGRSVADAVRMTELPGLTIIGNHGLERLGAAGERVAHPAWEGAAPRVRQASAALAGIPARFPGTALEDKHFSLSLHYRLIRDRDSIPALRALVSEIAHRAALRVSHGKNILDLLPALDVSKGDAVLQLVAESGAGATGGSILFAGDDVTDENAFAALAQHHPGAVTIRIGDADEPTRARFRLPSPAAFRELLEALERERASGSGVPLAGSAGA